MLLTSVTQLTGAFVSAAAALPMFEQIKPVLDEAPEVRAASTQPGELSGGDRGARSSPSATPTTVRWSSTTCPSQIRPGEFVAIVGPSGCGKSTLLRLLIGFDKPVSGSVLYDGQDLAALDQAAVRRQCGVVLQNAQPLHRVDPGLHLRHRGLHAGGGDGRRPRWRASPRTSSACRWACTPSIAGGGAISGGQRQRLMIAQALIRRPRILFFDEATSALDNETQRIVIESTRALNATRVVIAHRLSTVMDADRVIVMADGRVVQQGPPAAAARGHGRAAARAGAASDALNGRAGDRGPSGTPGRLRPILASSWRRPAASSRVLDSGLPGDRQTCVRRCGHGVSASSRRADRPPRPP